MKQLLLIICCLCLLPIIFAPMSMVFGSGIALVAAICLVGYLYDRIVEKKDNDDDDNNNNS